MRRIFSERFAQNGLLLLLSLSIAFHLAVLSGIVPFAIVWGGRIADRTEMLRMEAVSIGLNCIMLAAVAVRAGFWGKRVPARFIKGALWFMLVLFALNTLGNLFSANGFEKAVFTPLTLVLALFCLRLVQEKKPA